MSHWTTNYVRDLIHSIGADAVIADEHNNETRALKAQAASYAAHSEALAEALENALAAWRSRVDSTESIRGKVRGQ